MVTTVSAKEEREKEHRTPESEATAAGDRDIGDHRFKRIRRLNARRNL